MNQSNTELLEKLKSVALKRCEERIKDSQGAPGPPKKDVKCDAIRSEFTSFLKRQHGLL